MFIFLDSALGEYDVETRLGGLEVVAYSALPSDKWKRLEVLGNTIDTIAKSRAGRRS